MNALYVSAVRGRFRRQVTSVMLVLSLSVGGILATPTPAYAATSVAGCFVTAIGYQTLAAGTPVYLMFWNGSAWQSTGSYFGMDRNGCVWMPTNPIHANLWLRLYVNTGGALGTYTGGGTFSGFSPLMARPGSGFHADLGIGFLDYSCAGKVNVCPK